MFQLELLGKPVSITFQESDEVLELLRKKGFTPERYCETTAASPQFVVRESKPGYSLFSSGKALVRHQPAGFVCEYLISRLYRIASQDAKDLVLLRGDVVRSREGKGVILAGGSFSGQTFLGQALASAGFQLHASYFVILNDACEILRFPSNHYSEDSVPVESILRLDYRPDRQWEANLITPGEMVLQLMPLLAGQQTQREAVVRRLVNLTRKSKLLLSGYRGEADLALLNLRGLGLID